jgi:hypothetical protein
LWTLTTGYQSSTHARHAVSSHLHTIRTSKWREYSNSKGEEGRWNVLQEKKNIAEMG